MKNKTNSVFVNGTLFLIFVLISCQAKKESCDYTLGHVKYEVADKNGYEAYYDLEFAQSCSKKTGRPILMMFSSYGSYALTGMEWDVLDNDEVREIIKENYVFVALYTTDENSLSSYDSTIANALSNKDKINSLGDMNYYLQIERYKNVVCPFYAIVDDNLDLIIDPIVYREKNFVNFLKNGIENFAK